MQKKKKAPRCCRPPRIATFFVLCRCLSCVCMYVCSSYGQWCCTTNQPTLMQRLSAWPQLWQAQHPLSSSSCFSIVIHLSLISYFRHVFLPVLVFIFPGLFVPWPHLTEHKHTAALGGRGFCIMSGFTTSITFFSIDAPAWLERLWRCYNVRISNNVRSVSDRRPFLMDAWPYDLDIGGEV